MEKIIFFGDSLSDTGNADQLASTQLGFSLFEFPYSEGRATNAPDGLTISEYLAQELGVDEDSFATRLKLDASNLLDEDDDLIAINYSFASATTNSFGSGIFAQAPVGFQSQIKLYLSDLQFSQEASLLDENNQVLNEVTYFINIGSNDILNVLDNTSLLVNLLTDETGTEILKFVQELTDNIAQGMTTLDENDNAISNFVVFGVAPLGETPLAQNAEEDSGFPITDFLTGISSAFNTQLVGIVNSFSAKENADAFYVDSFLIFDSLKTSGVFENTTDPFYNPETEQFAAVTIDEDTGELIPALEKADEYLFFDLIHPTDQFNQLAAELAAELIPSGFVTTSDTEVIAA